MSELKPCPFCGCSMRLESNRDWHRIIGDHALECVFLDSETVVVPATKEQRDIAASDWNTRAVPADHVVVPRELLERLYSSDTATALMAAAELRAILYP
ncbi:TPA: Lar family restriction alleviation protein [Pseudomonas aeruginosa]